MTRLMRRLVWTVGAAAFILAAGVIAAFQWWPRAAHGPPPRLVPSAWAEFRASPMHQAHVGRANVECGACHAVATQGFVNPGTQVCGNCHAKESAVAHRGGLGVEATDCLTCHAFAPNRPEPKCIGCHAQSHDKTPAIVQHAAVDCAQCHHVHESPSIVPATCTTCHEERALEHGEHRGSQGCRDCHQVHAPAAAALNTCSSCHAEPVGPRPADHASCIGCHQPHDFVAGGERACIRCHGEKTTLAEAIVPAHAICTSCHTPHAPADAAASCTSCHANVHVEHGKEGACVTCHSPHGDDPRAAALPCTGCHSKIAGVDTGAHAGGIPCEACHKPHAFAPLVAKTLCVSCHAPETMRVSSNPGHQDCASCHGALAAHAPAKAPVCASCHVKEQETAPPGHQACQGCHDPHAGLPTPTCATCHKAEAASAHGAIAGGCETCHRPHGPGGIASSPTCTTCHATPTLPALHAVAGHAACANCHVNSHEPPRDDRITCTGSCHTDRRNHQPQATICTGCHVFRR